MADSGPTEIIIGQIKINGVKNDRGEPSSKIINLSLYGEGSDIPYQVDSLALSTALNENNIENTRYQYEKICCDEFHLYLKSGSNYDYARMLIGCVGFEERIDRLFYCPFCGKPVKFVHKILAEFDISKEKKEVCSQKFTKV